MVAACSVLQGRAIEDDLPGDMPLQVENETDSSDSSEATSESSRASSSHSTAKDAASTFEGLLSKLSIALKDVSEPPAKDSLKAILVPARPASELEGILRSVQLTIGCLYEFPIRRPAAADRAQGKRLTKFAHYDPYDKAYIDDKFPFASDYLKGRLRKSIMHRRNLLDYRQEHDTKIKAPGPLPTLPILQNRTKTNQHASGAPYSETTSLHKSQEVSEFAPSSKQSTELSKATTFNPQQFTPIIMADPFGNDRAPVTESLASSAASSNTNHHNKLHIPPRPRACVEGNPFECPHCYVLCQVQTRHGWR